MKTSDVWKRRAINLFLLFHIFGVLFTPNAMSYLSQALAPIYRPYMHGLGLGHTWGFFAPEPVAPPMYIDYIIATKDGEEIKGRYPNEESPYFFRDRQNRRMSMSRYIVSNDDNIRNMFVRWQCLQHQTMTDIKLWKVTLINAPFDLVQKGEKKMTDPVDQKIEVLGTYYCPDNPV